MGYADAPKSGALAWVEFALSTPDHIDDWQKLQNTLSSDGVRCIEGPSSLGGFTLLVDSRDFEQAKREALALIARNALTLRLRKNTDSWVYEVWQSGKKIREESYLIKR